jgi:hypothetical protein
MGNEDPSESLRKVLESARNVRLGRGVVSKTSYVAVLPLSVWGVVAWRWSDNAVLDIGLLAIGMCATIFAMWFIKGTREFAERNPELALLEGAELLEWRRMEVAAKGVPPELDSRPLENRGTLTRNDLGKL